MVAVHLAKNHARGAEEFAGRVIDLVVTAEEAGVVVRDRSAVFGPARYRGQTAVAYQAVEELRVVEDVVVAVEVWVLVADRVEAVRAGGDDLAFRRLDALEDVVKRLDVALCLLLEQELVAGSSRRVAGAGLAGR